MKTFYGSGQRVLLTLWVGGMWMVGYLVTPTLFASLDDRAVAGMLAGKMFTGVSYVGLVAGTVLLVSQWRAGGWKHWRALVLVAMLILVMIGEFVVQPMMADLKVAGLEDAINRSRFGMLHGIASVLFLIESGCGLVLVAVGGIGREQGV